MPGRTAYPAACVALSVLACSACRPAAAPILLFNGRGASPGDVDATEQILSAEHLSYATVGSWQLNAMSVAEFQQYRLLIVPGGNFEALGKGLTASTAANLRAAVGGGLNYLGVCAGAFFAGNSPYHGLNLTSGVRFGFYGAEARGIRKAAVAITAVGGAVLDQYWEDGPELSGWGAVAARYPDGTPAVVEGSFGSGRVILTGVHPEAPSSWRHGLNFRTPIEADHAYAATLIRAALNRQWLPHE